ncbi:MAG TPA: helix-turn-helix domain-containing protein [Kiritimatiellia bacterium]|jgi:excisionase family DNA binding protein|nr:helix-turn-helix domain-containing protein [Kiritimatiellia bacterium]MBP9571474.1 helix-turn-helix domain-containing protein [Kiritimatiellia bacterium]HQF19907.1 helix-turn-helix domain-containing protein [Kiritimatiellia bacterium]HQG73805.1 helix-turn-helix domain-containing protein [Kiritimatiellia bacterium]HXK78559.1 helix-turn-helix domain-containing protein [Kiritimatiellia bacterium]
MIRPKYKAVIYVEKTDERGNIRLERVTTSQWVTVPQIAASVGVAPQTMYRMIVDDKVIDHYRINSQIRVRAEDFAAWLETRRGAEYERPGAK